MRSNPSLSVILYMEILFDIDLFVGASFWRNLETFGQTKILAMRSNPTLSVILYIEILFNIDLLIGVLI